MTSQVQNVLDSLKLNFTSGNDIPVTRATILREEYEVLVNAIADERDMVLEECQVKLQNRANELRSGRFVAPSSRLKAHELEYQCAKLGKMKSRRLTQ